MQTCPAKSILSTYNECGWFGSNYNINIYRGCNHGCIYCDSRSNCYNVIDFDRVRVKENVLEILEKELMSKRRKGVIITGSMSDSYNSFENAYQYTRKSLELMDKYGYGVIVDTKSDLVLRDIDILKRIAEHDPAVVNFTITCCNDDLSKIIEPHAPSSSKRFEALRLLGEQGITTGILLMPILPFINDTIENIKGIVKEAHRHSVKYIYIGDGKDFAVTLRDNQREYYYDKLDAFFPGIREKYKRYYGDKYFCNSFKYKELYDVFVNECDKYGILYKMSDIIELINKPYQKTQLELF